MGDYLPLLAALVALLAGLVIGKAWERYKLRDGRWLDRRRLRETPHYLLGLSFLVQGHVDQAIDELGQAVTTDADAFEIEMVLGNLLREKGQVSRAIAIHQTLLQRPALSRIEHAHVLLSLGLDFRRAGFIDRAIEAFTEVRRLDPTNRQALLHLQKLYEEQRQWADAFRVRQEVSALSSSGAGEHTEVLGFLKNEIGSSERRDGSTTEATRSFTTAIDIDARTAPAHLNLGDLREQDGDFPGAIEAWQRLADALPHRVGLILERLERAYRALGTPDRFIDYCHTVLAQQPHDWRTRLALARHLSARDQHEAAFDMLLVALVHHPHSLAVHQEVWTVLLALQLHRDRVQQYVSATRDAVFYLDPHVCLRCHYRSTELLWQCPQCHEWNTFEEERIAPGKDSAALAALD